jgi:hypothetical protein
MGGASIYTAVNDDTSDNDDSDEDSNGSNADGDGISELDMELISSLE